MTQGKNTVKVTVMLMTLEKPALVRIQDHLRVSVLRMMVAKDVTSSSITASHFLWRLMGRRQLFGGRINGPLLMGKSTELYTHRKLKF